MNNPPTVNRLDPRMSYRVILTYGLSNPETVAHAASLDDALFLAEAFRTLWADKPKARIEVEAIGPDSLTAN